MNRARVPHRGPQSWDPLCPWPLQIRGVWPSVWPGRTAGVRRRTTAQLSKLSGVAKAGYQRDVHATAEWMGGSSNREAHHGAAGGEDCGRRGFGKAAHAPGGSKPGTVCL